MTLILGAFDMRKMRAKLHNNTLPAAVKFPLIGRYYMCIRMAVRNMNINLHIQPLKTILKLTMEKKSDIMSVYTTTVVFAVFVFALSLCFYKSGYEEK